MKNKETHGRPPEEKHENLQLATPDSANPNMIHSSPNKKRVEPSTQIQQIKFYVSDQEHYR